MERDLLARHATVARPNRRVIDVGFRHVEAHHLRLSLDGHCHHNRSLARLSGRDVCGNCCNLCFSAFPIPGLAPEPEDLLLIPQPSLISRKSRHRSATDYTRRCQHQGRPAPAGVAYVVASKPARLQVALAPVLDELL